MLKLFLHYFKLETVLSVDLKRAWNTVHISQVLSRFCFQATCIQATLKKPTNQNQTKKLPKGRSLAAARDIVPC
jgi:hypothetical protein